MSSKTLPWYDGLTDGVHALGESAREYRTALTAIQLAVAGVDIDRVISQPGLAQFAIPTGTHRVDAVSTREPHSTALFHLGDLYRRTEDTLRERFEEASRHYAYGAVWAVRQLVVEGEMPPLVCPPAHLGEMPELNWNKASALAAARARVTVCSLAAEYGEELMGREYVSDHEAGQMTDALDAAVGIGEALYAYGQLAEAAVHFALLGPKAEWLAARRAAAASQG
ncbi:hypothetical protein [Streptomyces sp. SID3212]|uniref:hypothetical protein n=1 Tax=Streptomyces sp. SID3212 TaxID=2690259 RepID=UPI00137003AF|nr:hypothetical protein [Streptomyces sp. SID3212]MYV56477.1 hypothetical protein [Streptomyces sp. SID3212]